MNQYEPWKELGMEEVEYWKMRYIESVKENVVIERQRRNLSEAQDKCELLKTENEILRASMDYTVSPSNENYCLAVDARCKDYIRENHTLRTANAELTAYSAVLRQAIKDACDEIGHLDYDPPVKCLRVLDLTPPESVKRVEGLVEATHLTVARADDYADSYITQPVREAIQAFREGSGG